MLRPVGVQQMTVLTDYAQKKLNEKVIVDSKLSLNQKARLKMIIKNSNDNNQPSANKRKMTWHYFQP